MPYKHKYKNIYMYAKKNNSSNRKVTTIPKWHEGKMHPDYFLRNRSEINIPYDSVCSEEN